MGGFKARIGERIDGEHEIIGPFGFEHRNDLYYGCGSKGWLVVTPYSRKN